MTLLRLNGAPYVTKHNGETIDSVSTRIDGQRIIIAFTHDPEHDAPDTWTVSMLVGATRREKKLARRYAEYPPLGGRRGRSGLKALRWAISEMERFRRDYPDATLVIYGANDRTHSAYRRLLRVGFRAGYYDGEDVYFLPPDAGPLT